MESIAPTFNNTHQFSIRYTMWWNHFSTYILVFFRAGFYVLFFQLPLYWREDVLKILCENTGPYKWKMRLFYRNYFIPLCRVMWDEYGFRNAQCTLGFQAKNFPTSLLFHPWECNGCPKKQKSSRNYNLLVWFTVFQPNWRNIQKT